MPVHAGEKPPLKGLAKALLDREIQKGKHHPDEDVFASLQLYLRYKHLFEEAKALPRGKGALDISFSPFSSSESELEYDYVYDTEELSKLCKEYLVDV